MAERGRAGRGPRPRARAASVVVPFPRTVTGGRLAHGRLVPSGRSLLTAFGCLVAVLAAIVAARQTSLFAIRQVEVEGAPGWVERQVTGALAEQRGTSLVGLDLGAAAREVEALPTVASVEFDRAFPHTLRVRVVPERPVAVLRQGAAAWSVSTRGRIVARLGKGAKQSLPRVWVGKETTLAPGSFVEGELRTAVVAATPVAGARLPSRVTSVRTTEGSLALRLASGLELRLGDTDDVGLKLAVAARVIPLLRDGSRYLDVSVPERPVGGTSDAEPRVEDESSTSTDP